MRRLLEPLHFGGSNLAFFAIFFPDSVAIRLLRGGIYINHVENQSTSQNRRGAAADLPPRGTPDGVFWAIDGSSDNWPHVTIRLAGHG